MFAERFTALLGSKVKGLSEKKRNNTLLVAAPQRVTSWRNMNCRLFVKGVLSYTQLYGFDPLQSCRYVMEFQKLPTIKLHLRILRSGFFILIDFVNENELFGKLSFYVATC